MRRQEGGYWYNQECSGNDSHVTPALPVQIEESCISQHPDALRVYIYDTNGCCVDSYPGKALTHGGLLIAMVGGFGGSQR